MLRKVIVAFDSFKGSLSSAEATSCCAQAIREVCHACEVVEMPVADGGEGFAEVAARSPLFRPIDIPVHNPLGEAVTARYFFNAHTRTAVIEMAQACGLTLVPEHLRNPLRASSAGLGELIMDAANRNAKNIIIGIGGSATNDGGMGMLCALGFRFSDRHGHTLNGCGASLNNICQIDTTRVPDILFKTSILVACDVDNTFYGTQGATFVYAAQKGATPAMRDELEAGMKNFAKVISHMGHSDIATCRGGGAAGGVGGTLHTLLGAQLKPGIDVVLHLTCFDTQARDADLIITGEGKLDNQTRHGKTAIGILRHAQRLHVPVIALCGQLTDTTHPAHPDTTLSPLHNTDLPTHTDTRHPAHTNTELSAHPDTTLSAHGDTTLSPHDDTNLSAYVGYVANSADAAGMGFLACLSIINKLASLSQCIDPNITKHNLKYTTRQLINIINHYSKTLNKHT